ncbi:hypothetical protein OHC33_004178 [Knufia fluminis]|uniref:Uncharacterized protein n=1 Tax=Knufia fluminis TaxID=191047 RepID=A0AAN8I8D7_9EURO|nr:hypothetical protein OHC33_004178 [Knufia fluminis]
MARTKHRKPAQGEKGHHHTNRYTEKLRSQADPSKNSPEAAHKKAASKWILLQCRIHRRQALMQSNINQLLDITGAGEFSSHLPEGARYTPETISVQLSLGFLHFDQSTNLFSRDLECSWLDSAVELRKVFLNTFHNSIVTMGIQKECQIYRYEVRYPYGLTFPGLTVAADQPVLVWTGPLLLEWLCQWIRVMETTPVAQRPSIVGRLIRKNFEPCGPLWLTHQESSAWKQLNQGVEAVRHSMEAARTQKPVNRNHQNKLEKLTKGEKKEQVRNGALAQDIAQAIDRMNVREEATREAANNILKESGNLTQGGRREQAHNGALAQELTQAIDKLNVQDEATGAPTFFISTTPMRSAFLTKEPLTFQSLSGGTPLGYAIQDESTEDAEML